VTTAPPAPPGTGPTGSGDPAAGPPADDRGTTAPARTRHTARYVVVGLVLVGALVFLLAKGLGTALDFYLPADQAVAQKTQLAGKTFNLEGVVQPGSIHSTPTGVDFVVTSGGTHVAVHNSSSPPELFQANIPVIAVGHFAGDVFASDQILVKHSSNYIAQHPGRVTAPNGGKQ
jgi:cytochrome c-type biogenesis protein CcmE